MKCKEVNKQVGNKQVIKHIKDSLRSYLPGESISADVVGLASDFSPEGFDGVLVLCSETHLVCRLFQVEVLGPVRTVGGFYTYNRAWAHPALLQDRLRGIWTGSKCCSLHKIKTKKKKKWPLLLKFLHL